MSKPGNKEKLTTQLVLRITAGILLLFFAVLLIQTAVKFSKADSFYYTEDSLLRSVRNRDFPQLTQKVETNQKSSAAPKDQSPEYALLADYYRESVMYDACVLAGKTAEASQRKAAINRLREALTDNQSLLAARELDRLMNGAR